MFGGQNRSDEGKQAEQVRVTQMKRSAEIDAVAAPTHRSAQKSYLQEKSLEIGRRR
jgi:hypothetical protein